MLWGSYSLQPLNICPGRLIVFEFDARISTAQKVAF